MKRILIAASLLLSFSIIGVACKSQEAPSADQILSRYVDALGGKASIEKLNSRVMKGTIEWGEKKGVVEYYSKSPNKYMSVTTLSEEGSAPFTSREGFDGAAGWGVDPKNRSIFRDWTENENVVSKRSRDFYRELRLKEIYPTIALVKKDKADDREGYVVELTPSSGKPDGMFFDAQTGLLTYYQFELPAPEGKSLRYVYKYDDYREVDGVKLPFTIIRKKPSSYTIKFTEIKHNVMINDEQFSKPGLNAAVK